jgi:sucrose-6-phosphate hydrolase SacC (GH32 family)
MRFAIFLLSGLLAAIASGQKASPYDQPYRPQFHFSPLKNWTNDPNGLVYFDGEYHLFFQYNPFGDQWGHMSWGHAVSPDLVHWQELPVALPEENGVMIFTGSTVVDEKNTSGFCKGGKPCMVAVYTGHTPETKTRPALQTQNLAYSNDRGRTWTKFNGNPVLNLNVADFRDPNVFWSEASKRWIMAAALPNDHKVLFYGSPNLKQWSRVSEFGPAGATGGQWECPNIFQATVDGNPNDWRWVLKVGLNPGGLQGGSGEQYFVGRFDGTRFINENPASLTLWTDYGKDCYCALTFNGLPRNQRPIMLGWMSNWQYAGKIPTSPWRGQMTVPRTVSLKRFPEGLRLVQGPAEAFSRVRMASVQVDAARPEKVNRVLRDLPFKDRSFELDSRVDAGSAKQFGWKLASPNGAYTLIGYDGQNGEVFVDRTHSGETGFSHDFPARTAAKFAAGPSLDMRILVDRSSLEVFAGQGKVALTNLVFPPPGGYSVEFYDKGGVGAVTVKTWAIPSAWTRR